MFFCRRGARAQRAEKFEAISSTLSKNRFVFETRAPTVVIYVVMNIGQFRPVEYYYLDVSFAKIDFDTAGN